MEDVTMSTAVGRRNDVAVITTWSVSVQVPQVRLAVPLRRC
jgi:hypothetical protein